MKLLYCQDCGDIIAPWPTNREVRWCRCKRHAVWWENSVTGVLRCHDARGLTGEHAGWPREARAYVIGLTNPFLAYPWNHDAASIETIIDGHEDYYLFKKQHSVAIRIRPGASGDTRWAALPTGATV